MNVQLQTGQDGVHATFCRLCEAFCGIIATVQDGRVTKVSPDFDNPHSRGHACIKGLAIASVTYDTDRLLRPLKRSGKPGEFVPVQWDEALDDIADRLMALRSQHGDGALASYLGNPTGYSSRAYGAFGSFMAALGSRKMYGAGSQDANGRMVAYYMIHGGPHYTTVPDLPDCDFLLMIGANPLVSNGWMVWEPRWREDLAAIAKRGTVIVIDPRLTETARRFEHLKIRPDGDTFLLVGMLRALFENHLIDRTAVKRISVGMEALEGWVRRIDWEAIEAQTGCTMTDITALAQRFANARRAVVYGALGLCRGRFGTLGAYLASVINAVTLRYGAPGGLRFGQQLLADPREKRVGGYGEPCTRIGGFPSIARNLAMAMLPSDIETEGPDRVRALICSAGNPVLTAPGGGALEHALERLELHVSLDLYMNETNRHADYILPVTTFLERADWPLIGMHVAIRPFIQYTEAVVPPLGEAREDYVVYHGIAERLGLHGSGSGRRLAADPNDSLDKALRAGPIGDHFGQRSDGWSRDRLRAHPHGVLLASNASERSDWPQRIGYPDGKLRIWHDLADAEMERLNATPVPDPATIRLIGRRDIRSINSWMHNVDRLVRAQTPQLHIHPADAARAGVSTGEMVHVTSEHGSFQGEVFVTTEISPGCVSYPHGWGHAGGWQRANATGGGNMNRVHGTSEDAVERISGMSLIDCQDVRITQVSS